MRLRIKAMIRKQVRWRNLTNSSK